jgi:hypothetical protein
MVRASRDVITPSTSTTSTFVAGVIVFVHSKAPPFIFSGTVREMLIGNGYINDVKKDDSPEAQLDTFIDKYSPEVAAIARACLRKMRARLPGATQLVYDNYNALAIGFGSSEKASHAIFSIVLYPRWVSFFFLQGAVLDDPQQVLKGSGSVVRHIVLKSAADLDQAAIQALMAAALRSAVEPVNPKLPGGLIIKSISAKQRPRLPDSLEN